MQTIGHARGLGEGPGGRGAHLAASGMDSQRGRLGSGDAQPGRVRVQGLEACLGKREPALLGTTPAAFMLPTIAQHHTGFLESRAITGRAG